jgi:glycosyltransferase involved in cell wall biosynthesis
MDAAMEGVSFVIPVRNGARFIGGVLEAIAAQADGRPFEMIVVEDGSVDGTAPILERCSTRMPLRIIQTGRRVGGSRTELERGKTDVSCGAAAALNIGIRAAAFPIICQVDQDVFLQPGWMQRLTNALTDRRVAAVQGYYLSHPEASVWAKVMNRDLEHRYASMCDDDLDHVCTGNVAYRAEALRAVGLFDETLGYGYDNDVSYRLRAAGYRLAICREARSVHRWREDLRGYLTQQYGFGYGRLDLVAKHPRRLRGDRVSPGPMMAHAPALAVALLGLAAAAVTDSLETLLAAPLLWVSLGIIAALCLERLAAGVAAAVRFRDPIPLAFPVVHLMRDLAWVAAIVTWLGRRVAFRPIKPSHSMQARAVGEGLGIDSSEPRPGRQLGLHAPGVLCVIPAHNEAPNLSRVISELRARCPGCDVLVIDDGSTDGTEEVLAQFDVRWLRFHERMGIGGAIRAGLRYAGRLGYDIVVRMDGDGQHRADDLHRLLAPIVNGDADVVLGSRFADAGESHGGERQGAGLLQRALAHCLSSLTGHRVTDPTSGFCALGRRAIRLLSNHHPTGYAEAELRLFLTRSGLRAIEVPVRARRRFSGRTSLTFARLAAAAARAVLALLIVPLRAAVEDAGD